jgi:multiple sugar transport system permease protein
MPALGARVRRRRPQLSVSALSVAAFLLSLLMLFPFFIMLSTSFKTMAEITAPVFSFFPRKVLFSNYLNVLKTGTWAVYFKNSLIVTVAAVVASLVLNSMAGYAFARIPFRGRDLLFIITLVGLMVPQQVTMLPVYVILKFFPLAGGNDVLGQGGKGFIDSYMGLILPNIAGSFGVFLFRQFMLGFPAALDDAATIDGLSRFGIYRRIYLPLNTPVIATLIALKATYTWNEYTMPLLLINRRELRTVQLALSFFRNEFTVEWNSIMAATGMIVAPIIILFVALQRYFVEGIVTTGVKG